MRVDKELIVPYSLAIGIFNIIFTSVIVTILSWIFEFSLTSKIYAEHYVVGYLILWLLNLSIIKSEGK